MRVLSAAETSGLAPPVWMATTNGPRAVAAMNVQLPSGGS